MTFRKYATTFRDGTVGNSKGGRPHTFDDINCKSIRDGSVKELKLDTSDFLKLMDKEVELLSSRRGQSNSHSQEGALEYWIWHCRRDH